MQNCKEQQSDLKEWGQDIVKWLHGIKAYKASHHLVGAKPTPYNHKNQGQKESSREVGHR
jgi:hypothetical protein